MVTPNIGQRDPDHVVGIHLNLVATGPDPSMMGDLTTKEKAILATIRHHMKVGTGYSQLQSTRPQTLGYGLVDSPAAQCAWIAEKFWSWVDCDGDLFTVLTPDELLDNVILHWLPATGASSARLYWESLGKGNTDPVPVPVGCSQFPNEVYRSSRRWAESAIPTCVVE